MHLSTPKTCGDPGTQMILDITSVQSAVCRPVLWCLRCFMQIFLLALHHFQIVSNPANALHRLLYEKKNLALAQEKVFAAALAPKAATKQCRSCLSMLSPKVLEDPIKCSRSGSLLALSWHMHLTLQCCAQMAIQRNISCCVPLQMWSCTLLHTQMHEGRQGCSCAEW